MTRDESSGTDRCRGCEGSVGETPGVVEGSGGRIYWWCRACLDEENKSSEGSEGVPRPPLFLYPEGEIRLAPNDPREPRVVYREHLLHGPGWVLTFRAGDHDDFFIGGSRGDEGWAATQAVAHLLAGYAAGS
jgi:hypothetical protein